MKSKYLLIGILLTGIALFGCTTSARPRIASLGEGQVTELTLDCEDSGGYLLDCLDAINSDFISKGWKYERIEIEKPDNPFSNAPTLGKVTIRKPKPPVCPTVEPVEISNCRFMGNLPLEWNGNWTEQK